MISVIVPAYNAEATLPECLLALRQQRTGELYEVIVVDDGSTDQTGLRASESGARVLRQPRQGPAAARNLGLTAAMGEILMFTDADCVPAPDWIEEMQAPLHDESVAGVKGAYATHQRALVPRLAQLEFEERYERLEQYRYVDFFDTHSLLLRKAVMEAFGGFDTFFNANNEDVDLAYRVAEGGRRLVFNRRAIVYHQHVRGWREYAVQKFWRGYWRMQVYHRHPAKMFVDSYTPHSLKTQIALAALTMIAAVLAPAGVLPGWVSLGLGGAFILSAWRLCLLAARRDPVLLPVVPCFITVRALAVGSGVAVGILTILRVLPVLRTRPERAVHETFEQA